MREPDYHSFMLRLWRAPGTGGRRWQASLQRVSDGSRWGFASLADLVTFLKALTNETDGAPKPFGPERDNTR